MPQVFYSLAILACPVGMGLMMFFMMRSGKKVDSPQPPATPFQRDAELARLRAELDQMQAERDEKNASTRPEQSPR